jgi:hypothetical protein
MQKGQTLCEKQILVDCTLPKPSTLLRRRPASTSHGRSLAKLLYLIESEVLADINLTKAIPEDAIELPLHVPPE